MISFPYTSMTTYEAETGMPLYDRPTNSEQQRQLNLLLYSPGVDVSNASAFQVTPGTGMTVVVAPGLGMSRFGGFYFEGNQRTLQLTASNAQDRIDAIVVRDNLSSSVRAVDLYVLTGTPALSPAAPAPTRNSTVSEQVVAHVFVPKNTAAITSERISSKVMDAVLCGVFTLKQITPDLAPYYAQHQAIINAESAAWQEQFSTWFENIKGQLSTDAAGNLQNQISNVQSSTVHANFLDNWDFRAGSVVNQRAVSGTVSTAGYFIDRWKLVSGTATITAEGITLNGTMVQLRETALGLPFCASGIMASGTGTFVYSDAAKTFTVTSAGGTVSRVKLELGGVSTLAADAPMNYGAELTKCQYYFERGQVLGVSGVPNWYVNGNSFKVQKRISPTMSNLKCWDTSQGKYLTLHATYAPAVTMYGIILIYTTDNVVGNPTKIDYDASADL